MKQRPFVIKLLAWLYFLSPIFILLELFSLYGIGLNRLFLLPYVVTWHTFAMMIITPIVGYGIWSEKKWGYYLLIVHSVIILANNIVLYADRLTAAPLWLIVVFNVLLLGVIITFVRKEVYAPYFNPKIRWWEQAKRYYYNGMKVIVKQLNTDNIMFEAKSFDLSETGLFVVAGKNVSVGEKFSFELMLKNNTLLYADGEVMWTNVKKKAEIPAGFGCRFVKADNLLRKRIRHHLKDIEAKVRER